MTNLLNCWYHLLTGNKFVELLTKFAYIINLLIEFADGERTCWLGLINNMAKILALCQSERGWHAIVSDSNLTAGMRLGQTFLEAPVTRAAKFISVEWLSGAKLGMPLSSSFCWLLLTKRKSADMCWQKTNLLTFADKKTNMLRSADKKDFSNYNSYTNILEKEFCWHLRTFADKKANPLKFAEHCQLKRHNTFSKELSSCRPVIDWRTQSLGYQIFVPKRAWVGPSCESPNVQCEKGPLSLLLTVFSDANDQIASLGIKSLATLTVESVHDFLVTSVVTDSKASKNMIEQKCGDSEYFWLDRRCCWGQMNLASDVLSRF